jgi:hypothetical protein
MGQWFESLSAHSHDLGERGQGGERDTETGDAARRATAGAPGARHRAPGEPQAHPPTQSPGGTTRGTHS